MLTGGTFTIRRETKRLESVDEKAREKKERGGVASRGEPSGERRWRGRRGRKAGLSRVVSLTSARSPHNHNKLNLGISPPEGTSRLHWEGRAQAVVKAGCS